MPNRPTREFWRKVYPKVYAGTKEINTRTITASIWHKKLKPATKSKFEKIRRKRE